MFSKRVENTMGKGEIARYEQFLRFSQSFQKTCTHYGMGLTCFSQIIMHNNSNMSQLLFLCYKLFFFSVLSQTSVGEAIGKNIVYILAAVAVVLVVVVAIIIWIRVKR